MQMDFSSDKPIFLQISEGIEDAVISGAFPEQSQIPSITEFSVTYNINPATALKGINLLVDDGIIYKKRGVGMFVSDGAADKLREKRKEAFFDHYVVGLVDEAARLGITREDLLALLERGFKNTVTGEKNQSKG